MLTATEIGDIHISNAAMKVNNKGKFRMSVLNTNAMLKTKQRHQLVLEPSENYSGKTFPVKDSKIRHPRTD